MRIEFDVTEDDLVAAAVAQMRFDPWLSAARRGLRSLAVYYAAFGAFLLVAAAFDYATGAIGSACVAAAMCGAVLCALGLKTWPTREVARTHARAQVTGVVRHPTGQLLLGTRAVELAADGFRQTTLFSESFVRWSAVLYLETDDDYLYLGIPGPGTVIVPRQAFETDSRFEAFAAAAEQAWRANTGGERPV